MAAALGLILGQPAPAVAATALAAALALGIARWWRPAWELPLHVAGLVLLALFAGLAGVAGWWAAVIAALVAGGTVWTSMRRVDARLAWAESQREEVATQLDRRITELFSLQELSYVLSESIQVDRIVDQVVRYAARFLQASGALVVLREGEGERLRVVAADGTLAALLDQTTELGEDALVTHAIERDRIEVVQGVANPSVDLLGGLVVRSAAVAPLRAHGVTMGALAVVDRREGPFTTEDLWLLSTVATQASVVLANGRLFEMVRRSKEEWETAFNALAEGVAVVGPTGAITRANRALIELVASGETAEAGEIALLGRDLGELLFGEAEPVEELIAPARRGERPAPLLLRADPLRRTLRLTAAPIAEQAETEANASVVLLVEDVTDQRAMEAQLIQNEKMAAIGQLVSGVAHELNNPLTSIAGLTELLLERGPMTEAPREHLRVIHEQAERAGRIVRNLLTFARKGAPEKEAVDLNDVVARTSLLFVYDLKLRGVELETRLYRDPVHAMGDRYELQQVLLNLVTNAAQAVSELPPDHSRAITVETLRQGDQAVLRVRDTGPGVPPAHVPYLFTPFFTTKGPGHGTGLGLSLSYGIVDAHGGRLLYQTAPGGGAEFTIMLPLLEHEAPAPPLAIEEAHPRGRRILVVDDDAAVHRFVSALFTPDGHTVEVTRNGQNALRLVEDAPYDLVIADARAAAGSELFVAAFLERHPTWRDRLVVATHGRSTDGHETLGGEALHRLPKPFNLRELRGLAAEIFGRVAA